MTRCVWSGREGKPGLSCAAGVASAIDRIIFLSQPGVVHAWAEDRFVATPLLSRASVSKVELDDRPVVGVPFTPVCAYASCLVTLRSVRRLSA